MQDIKFPSTRQKFAGVLENNSWVVWLIFSPEHSCLEWKGRPLWEPSKGRPNHMTPVKVLFWFLPHEWGNLSLQGRKFLLLRLLRNPELFRLSFRSVRGGWGRRPVSLPVLRKRPCSLVSTRTKAHSLLRKKNSARIWQPHPTPLSAVPAQKL